MVLYGRASRCLTLLPWRYVSLATEGVSNVSVTDGGGLVGCSRMGNRACDLPAAAPRRECRYDLSGTQHGCTLRRRELRVAVRARWRAARTKIARTVMPGPRTNGYTKGT